MKIVQSASSKSRIVKLAIDSNGTAIAAGALITMGVSAGSNMGAFIISGAAAADAVGVILNSFTNAAQVDSITELGTVRTLAEVAMLAPSDIVAVEYDLADTVAIATGGSTTSIITSSDEESGNWHYFTGGAAIGQLLYILSYSGDTSTYKAAASPTIAASDTLIRIMAPGRTLAKLTTNRAKFGTDAGEGTAEILNLRNEFTYDGAPGWLELDYVLHHGLTLTGLNPKFRSLVCFTNCAVSPIA